MRQTQYGPRVVAVDSILLGDVDDGLRPGLAAAARLLATATAADVLAALVQDRRRIDTILGVVTGIDHVGFMAGAEPAAVGPAARAAGFGLRQRSFPSTILARRLGALTGRETVATTIFKGESEGSTRGVVEVATPHGVGPRVVRDWIRRGIGAHVAFRLESPAHFDEVVRTLSAEGYRLPAFMNGMPCRNPAEGVAAVFLERRPAQPIGLEFCHYERQVRK